MSTALRGRPASNGSVADGPQPAHDGGTRLRLYRNPLRLAVSPSLWRAAWFLAVYVFVVGWALFAVALTVTVTAAVLLITLARYPAAGRRRGGAAVVRRRRARPGCVRCSPGRSGPGYRPASAGPPGRGQGPMAGPGHLARCRLPGRALGAAFRPGHDRAQRVADLPGPGHPAGLVLGAARQRRASGTKARRPSTASRSATSARPARARRGRTVRGQPAGRPCSPRPASSSCSSSSATPWSPPPARMRRSHAPCSAPPPTRWHRPRRSSPGRARWARCRTAGRPLPPIRPTAPSSEPPPASGNSRARARKRPAAPGTTEMRGHDEPAAESSIAASRSAQPRPTQPWPTEPRAAQPRPAHPRPAQPRPEPGRRAPFVERVAGWSARHRKTAVFGWLALVALVFAGGQALGTKSLPAYDAGQSGQAEQALHRLGVVAPAVEDVLIQARRPGRTFATDPAMRQAARQVAAALARCTGPRPTSRSPPGHRALVSADGRSALVTFQVPGRPTTRPRPSRPR